MEERVTTAAVPTSRSEADDQQLSLTVVMPVYNEEASVGGVLDDLLPAVESRGWSLLIVDDGSTDGTAAALAAAQSPCLRVMRHARNRGYGAALKTGIRSASTDLVACMDADGQHAVSELLKVAASASDNAMVVGQRKGLTQSPLWRVPGKWLLTFMARLLLGRRIPDLNSGLRVFRADVIRRYIHLCPDGFSFSTTSTFVLMHRGYSVSYVPIEVSPRGGRSAVTVGTGFQAILLVVRLAMLLSPLRIFVPLAAASFFGGLLWTIPYLMARRGVTVAAVLLILNGVLVLLFGLLADQIASLRKERFET